MKQRFATPVALTLPPPAFGYAQATGEEDEGQLREFYAKDRKR
jgi:hypothetical protein